MSNCGPQTFIYCHRHRILRYNKSQTYFVNLHKTCNMWIQYNTTVEQSKQESQ